MALTDNLLCYYKLSDPTDETGNHAGTNRNTPTYAAGKIGNAVTFVAASTQYIELANNFVDVAAMSISAWVKTTSSAQYLVMFGVSDSTTVYGIYFALNPHGDGVRCPGLGWRIDSSYRVWISNDAIASGNWAHVVIAWNHVNAPAIYINGSPVSGVTLKLTAGSISGTITQPGAIGRDGAFTGGFYFDGSVDELGVWSRAITSTEVTTLYNGGTGLQYPFTTGPDFTKLQINIGDAWKAAADMKINIGDAWKQVSGLQINIGDAWKTVF